MRVFHCVSVSFFSFFSLCMCDCHVRPPFELLHHEQQGTTSTSVGIMPLGIPLETKGSKWSDVVAGHVQHAFRRRQKKLVFFFKGFTVDRHGNGWKLSH